VVGFASLLFEDLAHENAVVERTKKNVAEGKRKSTSRAVGGNGLFEGRIRVAFSKVTTALLSLLAGPSFHGREKSGGKKIPIRANGREH